MKKIEPQDLAHGTSKFSRFIRRIGTGTAPVRKVSTLWKKDNLNDYDTYVLFDCKGNRHGKVGTGKSDKLIQFLLALGYIRFDGTYINEPRVTIAKNLVLKNDYDHHWELLRSPELFLPVALDEGQWFWYNRWHGKKTQVERVLEFMTNRKENKFHLTATPSIWRIDKALREDRIQWRIISTARDRAKLFQCGPMYSETGVKLWDEKKDKWGLQVTEFHDIPKLPEYYNDEYQRCIDELVIECKQKKDKESGEMIITNDYLRTSHRASEVWET